MTVKSILQDFFTSASNFAFSAFQTIKWGLHTITNQFDSQIVQRINSSTTFNKFSQSTKNFIATPIGKLTTGVTLIAIISSIGYCIRKNVEPKKTSEKDSSSSDQAPVNKVEEKEFEKGLSDQAPVNELDVKDPEGKVVDPGYTEETDKNADQTIAPDIKVQATTTNPPVPSLQEIEKSEKPTLSKENIARFFNMAKSNDLIDNSWTLKTFFIKKLFSLMRDIGNPSFERLNSFFVLLLSVSEKSFDKEISSKHLKILLNVKKLDRPIFAFLQLVTCYSHYETSISDLLDEGKPATQKAFFTSLDLSFFEKIIILYFKELNIKQKEAIKNLKKQAQPQARAISSLSKKIEQYESSNNSKLIDEIITDFAQLVQLNRDIDSAFVPSNDQQKALIENQIEAGESILKFLSFLTRIRNEISQDIENGSHPIENISVKQ